MFNIANSEIVYLFDTQKGIEELLQLIKAQLPRWSTCNSVGLDNVLEVAKPFEIDLGYDSYRFEKGTKLIKLVIYGILTPWFEESELKEWIFEEDVPGVHLLNGKYLSKYATNDHFKEMDVVFKLDEDFMDVVDFEIGNCVADQANL